MAAATIVSSNGGKSTVTPVQPQQPVPSGPVINGVELSLPGEASEPTIDLRQIIALVYGGAKLGKTTFCVDAGKTFVLELEPCHKHLKRFGRPVNNWETLIGYFTLLAKGHSYTGFAIDTIDVAYEFCENYICRTHGVKHIQDGVLARGKGYALAKTEFQRMLHGFSRLGGALFLVAHSTEKQIKTETAEYNKTVPAIPGKAREMVLGLVDAILFVDVEETVGPQGIVRRNVIRTRPTPKYEAGVRLVRGGRPLPDPLPLHYPTFAAAWNATYQVDGTDGAGVSSGEMVSTLPEVAEGA